MTKKRPTSKQLSLITAAITQYCQMIQSPASQATENEGGSESADITVDLLSLDDAIVSAKLS